MLLLQEFHITIPDKPRKDNVEAIFLSRFVTNRDDSPIEDDFPDGHLFSLYAYTLWYVDVSNYFVARKLPHHLFPRAKEHLAE